MGIYLNPKNTGFREAVNSEIYVDKTGLIEHTNKCMNTTQKYICVSRPRRFGKSMALEMLTAYYSRGCDSEALFKGLKIKRKKTFQKYLNQYDVICLNMQQFLIEAGKQGVTEYLTKEVLYELQEEYGEILETWDAGLAATLRRLYVKTDKQFVFLIDEWDCVMRERFDMDFEETSSWYDGYMFKKFQHIYNPKSVVEAMICQDFSNYWTSTEVYDALKVYIDMDFDGLKRDMAAGA